MDSNELFSRALGLSGGWKVVESAFSEKGGLGLELDFEAGEKFACPKCGASCPVHDTTMKTWRHMDFWQHVTELAARVPRVKCQEHGVLQVEVPWARPGSGFTLMMEAIILAMVTEIPVRKLARMLGEEDTRIWRILMHYVNEAHGRADWSQVRRILVDETSARKGHKYVTTFVDADSGALLLMEEGKESEVVAKFAQALREHGGDPAQIELIAMDMSRAFRAGAREHLPQARIVFDRFHVMQLAGKAIDQVRMDLAAAGFSLKGALWALRGNEWTRSAKQLELRYRILKACPQIGRALMLKEALQEVLDDTDVKGLRWWCSWADRSRLQPFRRLSRTLKEHRDGILAFIETRITNALIEAINGLLQIAKRLARGFRNFKYFKAVAYLKAGQLNFSP